MGCLLFVYGQGVIIYLFLDFVYFIQVNVLFVRLFNVMFLNFIIEEVLFCFGFDGNKVIIFLFVGFLVVGLCCG